MKLWSPHYRENVEVLEKLKAVARILPGLEGLTWIVFYGAIEAMGEKLIEMCKIMKYIGRVNGKNVIHRVKCQRLDGKALRSE